MNVFSIIPLFRGYSIFSLKLITVSCNKTSFNNFFLVRISYVSLLEILWKYFLLRISLFSLVRE